MTKRKPSVSPPSAITTAWGAIPTDRKIRLLGFIFLFLLAFTLPALASPSGSNPWENAVSSLQDSFTGPIAKGLSLVAIVVGGLMFAFGEGGSKKMLSGIVFGLGMALGAVNFISWLFPSS
jgi:type IV secretory pathway VirB2 component (pilin)